MDDADNDEFEIDGEAFRLVLRSQFVQPFRESDAVALAEQLLASNAGPSLTAQLGGPCATAADVTEQLATALAMGALRLIRLPEPMRVLDEPEIVNLSDLILGEGRWDDPEAGLPGAAAGDRQPDGPRTDEAATFLSFEVVDEAGNPLPSGYFDASAAALREEGELGEGPKRLEPLEHHDTGTLTLVELVLPLRPAAAHDPTVPTDAPNDGASTFVSFSVVDEDGAGLQSGAFQFESAATVHEGSLDSGKQRFDELGPEAGATVRLSDLVFA